MGAPLLKNEGVSMVVPAFRRRFPEALLLADMKTMDGGAFEARAVYAGGGNIIDFLALAGVAAAGIADDHCIPTAVPAEPAHHRLLLIGQPGCSRGRGDGRVGSGDPGAVGAAPQRRGEHLPFGREQLGGGI